MLQGIQKFNEASRYHEALAAEFKASADAHRRRLANFHRRMAARAAWRAQRATERIAVAD